MKEPPGAASNEALYLYPAPSLSDLPSILASSATDLVVHPRCKFAAETLELTPRKAM